MKWEVGKRVVAPGLGVGIVEAIEAQTFGDQSVELYRIGFPGSEERMWVPVDEHAHKKVRPVMSAEMVEQVWARVGAGEVPAAKTNWHQRHRRYMKALTGMDPLELADVLGELAAVRREKRLAFAEQRICDRIESFLLAEVAAASNVDVDQATRRLHELMALDSASNAA